MNSLLTLLTAPNSSPTISPDTADAHDFGADTTPTIQFTPSDVNGDDVRIEAEIDTVNTFDSQSQSIGALSLNNNGAVSKSPVPSSDLEDISFFAWVQIDTTNQYNVFFMNGHGGSFGQGYTFGVEDTGDGNHLYIDVFYVAYLPSDLIINDHNWHFVGFQRRASDGHWIVYLDDTSDDVGTGTPYSIGSESKMIIGGQNYDGSIDYQFAGEIARAAYWEALLSAGEIASLIAGAEAGTIPTNLVVDLPFDGANWGVNGGSGGNFTENGTLAAGGGFTFPGEALLDKISGTDAGFANDDDGGDTDPFTQGDQLSFTVQAGDALAVGTYYWRARAKDPTGTNQWSAWTTVRSLIISGGGTPHSITKSMMYAVLASVSPTKSLKYCVATTPTAKTKSAQYAIVKTTAPTKSLKYATISTPTAKTKSLKYTIPTTPTAKTKALAYSLLTSASKTKGLIYDIVSSPTAKTKSLKYCVETSAAPTKSLKYAVTITQTAKTASLKYCVVTLPSKTKSLEYVIETTAPIDITKSLTYTVFVSIGKTKSLWYGIALQAVVTKSLQYAVTTQANIQKAQKYSVTIQQTKTELLAYSVTAERTIQRAEKYTVVIERTIQRGAEYKIVTVNAIQNSLSYVVESAHAIQKSLGYIVVHTFIKTKSLRYVLRIYPYKKKNSPFSGKSSPFVPKSNPYERKSRPYADTGTPYVGIKKVL